MTIVYNVWLVDFELHQMAGYLNLLNRSFTNYLEELENFKLPTSDEVIESDEANEIFNKWYDEILSSGEEGDYRRRFYSAFVITWYAFVEENLLKICQDHHFCDDFSASFKNIPEKGIWLAQKLLYEHTQHRFKTDHWNELVLINKTRNSLVHNNGMFAYSLDIGDKNSKYVTDNRTGDELYVYIDKSLFRYLDKHQILHFYGTYFIKPNHEYCKHLIEFSRVMFDNLFTNLRLK